ncbi:MAG: hypothetical protein JEY99_07685 [Spirochaetales bacterium]|nr:hypothetical protein [Spirochaetales bacterium]
MDILGCGYDVFGKYAVSSEVKERILDLDALLNDDMVKTTNMEVSNYESIEGTSIDTYSSSLMTSAGISGDYRGFSGSIKTAYSEERYSSSEYSYATIKIYVHKYGLLLADRSITASLKPYLTETFSDRLNDPDFDTDTLFSTYGTHLMTGVVVGARLDYNISARTSDLSGSHSIGVYAEASYRGLLMSADVSTSVLSAAEYSNYSSSELKSLRAYGGDSQYAISIATKDDYDAWLETIDNNPVFCDYYENSLIPIWEFCNNDIRRIEVQEAFQAWAEEGQLQFNSEPRKAILDINVIDEDRNTSYTDGGLVYYKMGQDLNEDAGGDDVFIYAALGLDNDASHPPITDIVVYNMEDPAPPAGYVNGGSDTNSGAGGDYIYIYYSRDTDNGLPIRALRIDNRGESVTYSRESSEIMGLTFEEAYNTNGQIQDLSEGAGGDTIYLQFSRNYID